MYIRYKYLVLHHFYYYIFLIHNYYYILNILYCCYKDPYNKNITYLKYNNNYEIRKYNNKNGEIQDIYIEYTR